jgi:hypothetical protein
MLIEHKTGTGFLGWFNTKYAFINDYIIKMNVLTGFRLWPQYWRHFWGYIFFGGIFPSKMGRFAPFLATIQRLSKTCAFLPKKRSEGCFVWAAPSLLLARTYFIIALFS